MLIDEAMVASSMLIDEAMATSDHRKNRIIKKDKNKDV